MVPPIVRHGMGLTSALVLAAVAFVFLDGTVKWLVLGMAVVEAVLVPQLLKRTT
ncbi:hypothetical protein [Halomicrococcus gelatinilyticus]|uniref:hypothetical protein n=1 Tax=Halomicrococcus gelatinilyticus TaxID=1702103 RepID=UPI002E1597F2